MEMPVAFDLDDARPAGPCPQPCGSGAHRVMDRANVAAVHDAAVHRVRACALGEIRNGARLIRPRRHRVEIVLHDVDDRELPKPRKIRRLVERALVHGTVAEEAHHDIPAGEELFRVGSAGGKGNSSSDNGIGPQNACLARAQMH